MLFSLLNFTHFASSFVFPCFVFFNWIVYCLQPEADRKWRCVLICKHIKSTHVAQTSTKYSVQMPCSPRWTRVLTTSYLFFSLFHRLHTKKIYKIYMYIQHFAFTRIATYKTGAFTIRLISSIECWLVCHFEGTPFFIKITLLPTTMTKKNLIHNQNPIGFLST